MTVLFGDKDKPPAKLYLPVATLKWDFAGIVGSDSGNVVLSAFSVDDVENVDIRKCFNETNHIFAFGRDVERSVVVVDTIMFLGMSCDGGSSTALNDVRKAYERKRVSRLKGTVDLQIGEFTSSGFLVRMNIGGVDAATQTCHIVFSLILDSQGGN